MGESTYVWLVFWDDRFVRPQRVEIRHVTRLPDVTDADLERHLVDTEIPQQAIHATRVGGVARQILLKLGGERSEATGFGSAREGVAVPLGSSAIATGVNAEVLWRSDDPTAGDE